MLSTDALQERVRGSSAGDDEGDVRERDAVDVVHHRSDGLVPVHWLSNRPRE